MSATAGKEGMRSAIVKTVAVVAKEGQAVQVVENAEVVAEAGDNRNCQIFKLNQDVTAQKDET